MSRRFYVIVGVDVPEHFNAAAPEDERRAAERLISSLLRDALFVRDIDVTVSGALALSSNDVDRITLALRREIEHGEDDLRAIDAKMTELRRVIDPMAARREEA
jgi:hypothetical protein